MEKRKVYTSKKHIEVRYDTNLYRKNEAWLDLLKNPPRPIKCSSSPWKNNHVVIEFSNGVEKTCWSWTARKSSFLTDDEQSCYDIIT